MSVPSSPKVLTTGLSLLCCVTVVTACTAESGGRGGRPSTDATKGPVSVRVVEAALQTAPKQVTVDAPLFGIHQAEVYSKVTGRVASIGPQEGAAVKAGDLLFRIDRNDAGESFLNMPTNSPITGWVGRWHVTTVGEQVTPSDAVVTIVDDRTLRVIAHMPADDWTQVTPSTKVTATLLGQSRSAKVVSIARSADPGSGRGRVTVEIANPERDWRAGMYARLTFELAPRPRMLLSAGALIITDQGAYVYEADGSEAKRTAVQFRIVNPDTVEITEGVTPNAKIVIAGANLLSDKSRVQIVD
ncbi:MAG: HlyD family efflux transporter periplasmic adaptor subunit [Deltaproteobacteria bacterium]|nr:HlyD family efflux transporter periplasmic adaptor subunit [Deltaproteobacteria bacterium]